MKRFFISLLALASLTVAFAHEPLRVAGLTVSRSTPEPTSEMSDFKSRMIASALAETVTINGTLTAEQIDGYYGLDWWVVITSADYTVHLDIMSTTLAGTYDLLDMDGDNTDITTKDGSTIYPSTLSITITEGADGSIDLTGTITDSKGTTYNITAHKNPLPTPKDTIRLSFNDADLVLNNGKFYLSQTELFPSVSADSIHAAVGFYYSGKSINGTYEYKDRASYANYVLYCGKDTVKVEPWEILNATVTTNSGLYVCRVNMFGTDSMFYQLTLYTDAPDPITPKKTVDFWAYNLNVEDYISLFGGAIFEASNDDYYALIGFWTNSLYGSYTEDDLLATSTIITKTDTLSILTANLEFTNWGGVDMLYGTVIASDTIQYNILFDWEAPDAKDTTTITFDQVGIGEYVQRSQYIALYNENSDYTFLLNIATDSVGGKFTKDSLYSGSYIGIIGSKDTTYLSVYTADIKVTDTGKQTCTVEANILASDTIFYKIRSSFAWTINEGMDYDSESGAVDRTFTGSDNVTIDTYPEDNAIVFKVKSASDAMYLEFYTTAGATTIPAGTYAINKSEQAFTVYACDGVEKGYIYPSFYTALTEKGEVTTPIYFIESGTVEVEYIGENTKITVNAYNSFNVPIHIVYDSSLTALDEATDSAVRATKVLRDGRLYIRTADHLYDASGMLLK